MIIRQATEEDLDQIVEICSSRQVSRHDNVRTGFVEYPKTKEEFRKGLGPYFLVAETDKILGYAFAVEEHLAPELPYLAKHENYILWDQFAVRDESLASARAVVKLAEEEIAIGQKIIAFVAQKPFNKRSHSMLTKLGFVPDEYITVEGILLRTYILNNK